METVSGEMANASCEVFTLFNVILCMGCHFSLSVNLSVKLLVKGTVWGPKNVGWEVNWAKKVCNGNTFFKVASEKRTWTTELAKATMSWKGMV